MIEVDILLVNISVNGMQYHLVIALAIDHWKIVVKDILKLVKNMGKYDANEDSKNKFIEFITNH